MCICKDQDTNAGDLGNIATDEHRQPVVVAGVFEFIECLSRKDKLEKALNLCNGLVNVLCVDTWQTVVLKIRTDGDVQIARSSFGIIKDIKGVAVDSVAVPAQNREILKVRAVTIFCSEFSKGLKKFSTFGTPSATDPIFMSSARFRYSSSRLFIDLLQ